jgi:hypothetical protein
MQRWWRRMFLKIPLSSLMTNFQSVDRTARQWQHAAAQTHLFAQPMVQTNAAIFPSNDLTTHQLLDFMNEHFGFNADETVAILGAHTIDGRALPQNSGFQGQNGWSNNVFSLGRCLTYEQYKP